VVVVVVMVAVMVMMVVVEVVEAWRSSSVTNEKKRQAQRNEPECGIKLSCVDCVGWAVLSWCRPTRSHPPPPLRPHRWNYCHIVPPTYTTTTTNSTNSTHKFLLICRLTADYASVGWRLVVQRHLVVGENNDRQQARRRGHSSLAHSH
jgi:hypothetical protein